jgi:hypothetical protein
MNHPFVTDSWEVNHIRTRWLAIGLLLGMFGFALIAHALAEPEVIDPRMEKACQWPKRHGQAMMVAVIDGKILCWEMGR